LTEETRLNYKLNNEQDWRELARQANWSVTALARLCSISCETLRRFFLQQLGKSPAQWLKEERQQQAIALLRGGSSIKETAACLGYRQQTNFTRKFKEHWGFCPTTAALGQPIRSNVRK
jgi:AraC-like DNA-binding protein